ncbi:uncharacterized protein J7T54_000427 [Emericellopsis cladophorae]|uniref:Uncharacterized protein n=1 Tax=Emericellopsis cladophorae TaxID=2686198 RepID=A0A9Q0BCP3_9HYPO|nr:uncharacterized protein J7T54_000427 [Emericellopsis cladophorae]KAI6779329.1 hypothetical protein J7T54_000427 [Emericellopsis cladophorae]
MSAYGLNPISLPSKVAPAPATTTPLVITVKFEVLTVESPRSPRPSSGTDSDMSVLLEAAPEVRPARALLGPRIEYGVHVERTLGTKTETSWGWPRENGLICVAKKGFRLDWDHLFSL